MQTTCISVKSVLKHLELRFVSLINNQFRYCMDLYKEMWLRRHYLVMTVPSLDVGVHVNVKVDASTSPLWVTQFWKNTSFLSYYGYLIYMEPFQ